MRKSIHKQTIKSTNNLDTYAAYAAIFTSSKSQCAIFNYFLFLKEIVSVCLLMTWLVERVRCLCTANTKENWTKKHISSNVKKCLLYWKFTQVESIQNKNHIESDPSMDECIENMMWVCVWVPVRVQVNQIGKEKKWEENQRWIVQLERTLSEVSINRACVKKPKSELTSDEKQSDAFLWSDLLWYKPTRNYGKIYLI